MNANIRQKKKFLKNFLKIALVIITKTKFMLAKLTNLLSNIWNILKEKKNKKKLNFVMNGLKGILKKGNPMPRQ